MTKNKEINLVLHHNYLQIKKDDLKIQLPIRTAKLIHDMYEVRQADNEDKDIKHYTEDYNNYSYHVGVFLMGVKYPNSLTWFSKEIEPLKLESENEK